MYVICKSHLHLALIPFIFKFDSIHSFNNINKIRQKYFIKSKSELIVRFTH